MPNAAAVAASNSASPLRAGTSVLLATGRYGDKERDCLQTRTETDCAKKQRKQFLALMNGDPLALVSARAQTGSL
jgi:hypothetical protein